MPGLLFRKQEESFFLLSTIFQIIMGFLFAIESHVLLGREILVVCMQTHRDARSPTTQLIQWAHAPNPGPCYICARVQRVTAVPGGSREVGS